MFEENRINKKLIIFIGLLSLILIIGLLILLNNKVPNEVVEEPEVTVQPVEEPEEILEPVKEEKQSEATSILKARIIGIVDNTARVEYTVSVGASDTAMEAQIMADSNTIVYDAAVNRVVGLNGIKENMEVMFYGVGNYKQNTMRAAAIVLGGSNDMKYGMLSEIYVDGDKGYIGKISDNKEYINISDSTVIENGYTGLGINDLRVISPNSMIFYYVEPEFKQEPEGIYYDVNKIVIVKDGSIN